MRLRKTVLLALCTALVALAEGASKRTPGRVAIARSGAQYDAGYPTDSELRLLPEYCRARLRNTSEAEVERWRKALGYKNFTHIHHYCQSRNIINRADRTSDPRAREALLRKTLRSLKKLLEQVQPTFKLRYEIHYHIGRVADRLELPGEAVIALRQSIDLNPRYLPAYALLSDIYEDNGQPEEALRVVEAGLAQVPTSKVLRQRKLELESASEGHPER